MIPGLSQYAAAARHAGCPIDQLVRFTAAGLVLQPRQLAASSLARSADTPSGPTEIGFGGARGGGKSFWLFAQLSADDAQRMPGLKCLLLRKVGRANLEHMEDLRSAVLRRIPHEWTPSRGIIRFPNGSRIIAGHFQSESDIDGYLGLEYDVIAVEEATTLSSSRYEHIRTCCRSSKNWRPRIYSTANPGGVGHGWYKQAFIQTPRTTNATAFVPSRVRDNSFCNPEYRTVLHRLTGWHKRAWLDGDWDVAAGQYFSAFRTPVHVFTDLDPARVAYWSAALDYGFAHFTVMLLAAHGNSGETWICDEFAARKRLPEDNSAAIHALLARNALKLLIEICFSRAHPY